MVSSSLIENYYCFLVAEISYQMRRETIKEEKKLKYFFLTIIFKCG